MRSGSNWIANRAYVFVFQTLALLFPKHNAALEFWNWIRFIVFAEVLIANVLGLHVDIDFYFGGIGCEVSRIIWQYQYHQTTYLLRASWMNCTHNSNNNPFYLNSENLLDPLEVIPRLLLRSLLQLSLGLCTMLI